MIKTEPKVEPTAKYQLKDAALAMEISPSCLSKWTEKGIIKCGRRKLNGRRFWTGAELLRAWKAQM
jgi:DNA-binding transcriptional MerR regulator